MDAEEGRVVHRMRHPNKLAVVVAVQNVLVAACLLATLYVYWDVPKDAGDDDDDTHVHIQFDSISDIPSNTTLQFGRIRSRKQMYLADEKSKIYTNCTGPYILYMDVCYRSIDQDASGMLKLQVAGRKTPVITFSFNASPEACRELHSIVYLRANEEVTLDLYSTGRFKIKNVTVGLSYLLGKSEY